MTDGPQDGAGENLWSRLRRRKVVQWGIAYAAGAWGFLQGLAYVSSLLEWPAQLQKLTGLALLIGLPVVLVLAWFHGDRGRRGTTRTHRTVHRARQRQLHRRASALASAIRRGGVPDVAR